MRFRFSFRLALLALVAIIGFSSPSQADTGSIRFTIAKGGWFVGASGGSGTLVFRGRSYPVSIAGLSAGLVFGGSVADLYGPVYNIRSPYDVTGVYTAVGGGAAVAGGARAIQLRNGRGAVMVLQGPQLGLSFNLDLSGLQVTVR